jgi:hypothetical protein
MMIDERKETVGFVWGEDERTVAQQGRIVGMAHAFGHIIPSKQQESELWESRVGLNRVSD